MYRSLAILLVLRKGSAVPPAAAPPTHGPTSARALHTWMLCGETCLSQKSAMSIKFLPQFWGRKFMGAWHFWFFLQENPMPIKFLLLSGGGCWFFFFEGGVEVPILFLWAWGFFRLSIATDLLQSPKWPWNLTRAKHANGGEPRHTEVFRSHTPTRKRLPHEGIFFDMRVLRTRWYTVYQWLKRSLRTISTR